MGYGFDGDMSPFHFACMCGLALVTPDDRKELIAEGLFSEEGIFIPENATQEQRELHERYTRGTVNT